MSRLRIELAAYPEALVSIEGLLIKKQYKEAFMKADEVVARFGLQTSEEFKKADSDFYWLLR